MSSTLPTAAAFTGATVTEGQFKQAITDLRTFMNDPDSYQWYAPGLAPTYVSTTSFTLVGNQTAAFRVGRRLKLIVTAGTIYGRITASVFTTLTTLTVVLDSGALDSGLSTVYLSVFNDTKNTTSSLIFNTGSTQIPDAVTRYFGVSYTSVSITDVQFFVPFDCTISKLYTSTPGTSTGTRTYTLMVNNVATVLTCSGTGGSGSASDLVNSVSVSAGDIIAMRIVTSGGSNVVTHYATVQVLA